MVKKIVRSRFLCIIFLEKNNHYISFPKKYHSCHFISNSPYFIPHRSISWTMQNRRKEVIRCQSLLKASCVDNEIGMMPFINHSFKEVTERKK